MSLKKKNYILGNKKKGCGDWYSQRKELVSETTDSRILVLFVLFLFRFFPRLSVVGSSVSVPVSSGRRTFSNRVYPPSPPPSLMQDL